MVDETVSDKLTCSFCGKVQTEVKRISPTHYSKFWSHHPKPEQPNTRLTANPNNPKPEKTQITQKNCIPTLDLDMYIIFPYIRIMPPELFLHHWGLKLSRFFCVSAICRIFIFNVDVEVFLQLVHATWTNIYSPWQIGSLLVVCSKWTSSTYSHVIFWEKTWEKI